MSSFTINRVVLVGRLTKDPELRALPSGSSVCNIRIACSSVRRDAEGEYQEKPNYFDVGVFDGKAESTSRYTRKGSRVAIDGRLEWREWETPDQQRRQAVSVVADTVMFLDSSNGRLESGQQRDDESSDGFGGEDFGGEDFGGEETDQGSFGELGLRPAREFVSVSADAEEDDLAF
jgi:single-strand DNA-binding protein